MDRLKPGQLLLLNNRPWSIWQVQPLEGRNLEIEAIGASTAAQGMTRRLKAIHYGPTLFIEQQRGGYWSADLQQDWVETEHGPALNCKIATSLDLLAAHTLSPAGGELKNEFSWSYSRDARYRRCPRAYYYHYYAAWEGWQSEAPPPVRQAYLLKNLTNLPRWVGILVHDSIKFALARLKAGQPMTGDDLVNQMRRRAEADFEDSQSGRYQQKPNQLTGFEEHYYQINTPETIWPAAWSKAEAYLRTFINSTLYAALSRQPSHTFLDVETLQFFFVQGVKIWVQLDLARYDGQTIYLYDWKTGEIDETELQQQLGVYGLYTRNAWPEWDNTPLRGIVYDLVNDRLLEFELDQPLLQKTQTAIENSITRLQRLLAEPETNLAELRRFPMIDDLSVCRNCQFRALCGRDKK
jgi:hypothetical protein